MFELAFLATNFTITFFGVGFIMVRGIGYDILDPPKVWWQSGHLQSSGASVILSIIICAGHLYKPHEYFIAFSLGITLAHSLSYALRWSPRFQHQLNPVPVRS